MNNIRWFLYNQCFGMPQSIAVFQSDLREFIRLSKSGNITFTNSHAGYTKYINIDRLKEIYVEDMRKIIHKGKKKYSGYVMFVYVYEGDGKLVSHRVNDIDDIYEELLVISLADI